MHGRCSSACVGEVWNHSFIPLLRLSHNSHEILGNPKKRSLLAAFFLISAGNWIEAIIYNFFQMFFFLMHRQTGWHASLAWSSTAYTQHTYYIRKWFISSCVNSDEKSRHVPLSQWNSAFDARLISFALLLSTHLDRYIRWNSATNSIDMLYDESEIRMLLMKT